MMCLLLHRYLLGPPHHSFVIITSVPKRELLGTVLNVHRLLAFIVTSIHLPRHHLRLHNLRHHVRWHHHMLVLGHGVLRSMMVGASAGDLLAWRHSLSHWALHGHSLRQWGSLMGEEMLIHWPEKATMMTMEEGRQLLGGSKLWRLRLSHLRDIVLKW